MGARYGVFSEQRGSPEGQRAHVGSYCVGKSERKSEREDDVFELEFRKMGETL